MLVKPSLSARLLLVYVDSFPRWMVRLLRNLFLLVWRERLKAITTAMLMLMLMLMPSKKKWRKLPNLPSLWKSTKSPTKSNSILFARKLPVCCYLFLIFAMLASNNVKLWLLHLKRSPRVKSAVYSSMVGLLVEVNTLWRNDWIWDSVILLWLPYF